MLTLVLCAALSQNLKVAVVQSSNLGVPPKRAASLTDQLLELLINEKLNPMNAQARCDGRACLVATGKKLGAGVVVALALASLGKDTVMDLECISVSDGKTIDQTTFTSRQGESKLPFEAVSFVADLRRRLVSSGPHEVAVHDDAPKAATLTPEPARERPELFAERTEHSRAPTVALGAGAVAIGVAALVLFAVAEGEKREARREDPAGSGFSVHTRVEAERIAKQANTKYAVAGGLGFAAGLAAASALFFAF